MRRAHASLLCVYNCIFQNGLKTKKKQRNGKKNINIEIKHGTTRVTTTFCAFSASLYPLETIVSCVSCHYHRNRVCVYVTRQITEMRLLISTTTTSPPPRLILNAEANTGIACLHSVRFNHVGAVRIRLIKRVCGLLQTHFGVCE